MGLNSQILIAKNTQKFRAPPALQHAAGGIALKLKLIVGKFKTNLTMMSAAGDFFVVISRIKPLSRQLRPTWNFRISKYLSITSLKIKSDPRDFVKK